MQLKKLFFNEKNSSLIQGYLEIILAALPEEYDDNKGYDKYFEMYQSYTLDIFRHLNTRYQKAIVQSLEQKNKKNNIITVLSSHEDQNLLCFAIYNAMVREKKLDYGLGYWCFLDIISSSTIKKCNCQCRSMLFACIAQNFGLLGTLVQLNMTYRHIYASVRTTNLSLELTDSTKLRKQKVVRGSRLEKRTSNIYHLLAYQVTQLHAIDESNKGLKIHLQAAIDLFLSKILPKADKATQKVIQQNFTLRFGSSSKYRLPPNLRFHSVQEQLDAIRHIYNRSPLEFYTTFLNASAILAQFIDIAASAATPLAESKTFAFFLIRVMKDCPYIIKQVAHIKASNSILNGIYNIYYDFDERNNIRHNISLSCIRIGFHVLRLIYQRPRALISKIFVSHVLQNICLCSSILTLADIFKEPPPETNMSANKEKIQELKKKSQQQNQKYLQIEMEEFESYLENLLSKKYHLLLHSQFLKKSSQEIIRPALKSKSTSKKTPREEKKKSYSDCIQKSIQKLHTTSSTSSTSSTYASTTTDTSASHFKKTILLLKHLLKKMESSSKK
jgi:hypothetical protein